MSQWDKKALGAIILRVEKRLAKFLKGMPMQKSSVSHFGAYDIHPRHLVFCIVVKFDRELALLEKAEITQIAHTYLEEEGYPAEGVPETAVRIDSEETVNRDYNGNWYRYYK